MLKTIRNDISNATYDARCCCIYDGPLGPAVTPKERRNRRLALLVFFICAFVAILVLSINQVERRSTDYGTDLSLNYINKNQNQNQTKNLNDQLELLQNQLFRNNINKIGQLLMLNENINTLKHLDGHGIIEGNSTSDQV